MTLSSDLPSIDVDDLRDGDDDAVYFDEKSLPVIDLGATALSFRQVTRSLFDINLSVREIHDSVMLR